jgi:hypothetical protein
MNEPSGSKLRFVELNERAYRYIRQFSVKSLEDVLVELITNSSDAYNRSAKESRPIAVEYCEPNILKVTDQALGMTGKEMERNFLQVGGYTNVPGNRGFFSRGAKDISSVGDVYFDAIKDGCHSQCQLDRNAYGGVTILDQPVTDELRQKVGVTENGLAVTVHLLPNFCLRGREDLIDSVSKLVMLRDILSNPQYEISFKYYGEGGKLELEQRIGLSVPKGRLLLDLDYLVPGYGETRARFTVYQSSEPFPQPKRENEIMFGFLVKDRSAVYESTTFESRFRWNPHINYLYGSLDCEELGQLMLRYDREGSTRENPVPILDPSRLSGLNRSHPFIEALFSIPCERVDGILIDLNERISRKTIGLRHVHQLFNELSLMGSDLLEREGIDISFAPNYESKLFKAINRHREAYVVNEVNLTEKESPNESELEVVRRALDGRSPQPGDSFLLDGENRVVKLDQKIEGEPSSGDVVKVLNSDQIKWLERHPHLYYLNSEHQLKSIYVYQRGFGRKQSNRESGDDKGHRKFRLSFISDERLLARYTIEYANGVEIRLNIASFGMNEFLGRKELNLSHIDKIRSKKSLVFLQEIITLAMADVVVEGEVMNGRLDLDQDFFSNTKLINGRRNEIICRIERPIIELFQEFIKKEKQSQTKGN